MKQLTLATLLLFISASCSSQAPILVSEADSTRAIAVEAGTFKSQPIPLKPSVDFAEDGAQRVILFAECPAMPVDLHLSATLADESTAELPIENIQTVDNLPGLYMLTARVPDSVRVEGDALVRLVLDGKQGNRVRVGFGHIGGGPVDTEYTAATPYPAPSPTPVSPLGLIIFDGNSLTAPGIYPAQTIAKLNDAGKRFDWFQFGVGGQSTLEMLADVKTQVDPLIDLKRPTNIVIAWEAINDIYKGATGQEAFDHMKTYCLGRRVAGFKVIVMNAMPAKPNFVAYPAHQEPDRRIFNALLAAHWAEFADGYVDLTADPQLGCDDCPDNRDIFVDGVHLTTKGYGIVAGMAKAAIESIL